MVLIIMGGELWKVCHGWWVKGGGRGGERSGELFLEHCEANCEDRM